jgi:uncharacterized protein YjbI with pentapeptide repeats
VSQHQQPRPEWEYNWRLLLICAFVFFLVIAFIVVSYVLDWWWTGFPPLEATDDQSAPKTLWDWLGLLIIPAVLGFGAIWFNNQARKSEQAIAQDGAQEEALQRYLDTMQGLILDKRLKGTDSEKEIRDVARVRTLAVVRSLNGTRKGHVVRFLHEAGLIGPPKEESGEWQPEKAIISLEDADLSTVYLEGVTLIGVNLSFANLSNAILPRAFVDCSRLLGANLMNANLRRTNLFETDLSGADLRGADLTNARECTHQQLAQAKHLMGATLPDGTVIRTKKDESAYKEQHRK